MLVDLVKTVLVPRYRVGPPMVAASTLTRRVGMMTTVMNEPLAAFRTAQLLLFFEIILLCCGCINAYDGASFLGQKDAYSAATILLSILMAGGVFQHGSHDDIIV